MFLSTVGPLGIFLLFIIVHVHLCRPGLRRLPVYTCMLLSLFVQDDCLPCPATIAACIYRNTALRSAVHVFSAVDRRRHISWAYKSVELNRMNIYKHDEWQLVKAKAISSSIHTVVSAGPHDCIWRRRKPSCRWQTRATRKHAKIAPIRPAYNVVADNTGLSSFV